VVRGLEVKVADDSKIEWTDATWNPVRGCSRISEGCRNCYAEGVAARFSGAGQPYEGLAKMADDGPRWTGKVKLVDLMLRQPFAWQRPRKIFVNSMSDLFHERLQDKEIAQVFAVMALTPRHTFQVLTKRAPRMAALLASVDFRGLVESMATVEATRRKLGDIRLQWPLPNVWIGVSVEDQKAADTRITSLLSTPAAVRFLSCEPLLGPVNLGLLGTVPKNIRTRYTMVGELLHWVIVGGESGPDARPMHSQWARDLRDECQQAQVAFFFKQWGEWCQPEQMAEASWKEPLLQSRIKAGDLPKHTFFRKLDGVDTADLVAYRVGKKRAGRELDGRTWDSFPEGVK
jgi:protein gp37